MAKSKVLEAIISIAGHIDPSLQKSLKQAQGHFSGVQKAAKVTGAVAAAGMAAATAATIKAVQAAAEYEVSFAKTATLLTGTSEDLKEYSQEIIKMSNNTGIAAGELTETVYSAISAGIDQADAVEFAGQAAKLAAGGFTDSATAVDVMTTALNAYGLEADSAGKISDYLITTQNLGKTTVNELASSVGKVIPIASAYGVEMDNLSAAYAQLTAGGIATAEAGTYLKSMLNELGDSGSNVSDVLKKQTGMSFAELTESGKSLGDIMAILGESVGGDAGAFNELWSSSEAGVGALSLLNGGAEAYNDTLDAMRNSAGATEDAYNTMSNTLEHQMKVIKNLGKNFMINIGQKVLPYVSELAEKAIPMITDSMDGMMESVGPILNEIARSLFPMFLDAVKGVGGAVQELLPYVETSLKTVIGFVTQLLPMLSQFASEIMPLIETVLQTVFDVLGQLMPIFMEIISAVLPVIQELIVALMPVITTLFQALSPIVSLVGDLISTLLPPLVSVINSLMPIIKLVAKIISTVLMVAIQALSPVIEGIIGVVGFLADIFSTVFEGLVGIVAKPINAIIGLVNTAIEAINGISVDVPDWVPIIGGTHFGFSIPLIPTFAQGGFTDGVSIAGEAGTEAVISFDPAYRSENLSYWAKAGQMLGATDSDLLSLIEDAGGYNGGTTQEVNLGGVTFAPNITIQGSATKDDVIAAIREAEPEFFDLLEEFIAYRGDDSYEPAY